MILRVASLSTSVVEPAGGLSSPQRGSARLMPHTLLWQTFMLIALLLILALAAWSQIFRHFQEPARARDLAQMVVSVVNLTRTALINAEVSKRTELLIDLAALEGIRIYPSEPSDEIVALPDTRPMRLLSTEIRRQLGSHTKIASRWKTLEGFWISFRVDPDDHEDFWVMLPPERLQQTSALDWLMWGGGAMLVALLGAFLVVSRISAPLRNLARSARMVGDGKRPPLLPETGPQEIATVTHAFNQMTGDLARNDAERALILAGVSHDLRTPLARLRLGIEMAGAPDDELQAMVSDIEEMDRIIGQFLDFGRGESAEAPRPTDVVRIVHELAEHYRLRGVILELHLPESLELNVRPLPVRRALSNLIDNAIRYAGEDKPIAVNVARIEQEVVMAVADAGPGIPAGERQRMLQPFTRLVEARSDTKGAGLGLAIVDRVMRAHAGRIELGDSPAGGLSVKLHFPVTVPDSGRVRIAAQIPQDVTA